ncbi:MAG: hypothetical protein L6Q54_13885 [Leptospiraceae bacterium]|nr:hypothetical protein [Leptospiraceae bacterium]MCK6382325.1 hypothetical protein [Leptospiraceae bacterium]NUM40883.1 hypothetical protein [Leptospiraceae bacterium]
MNSKVFLFIIILSTEILSNENIKYTLGGTAEILQSRFIQENSQSKTSVFGAIDYSYFKAFLEKRNEIFYGSGQIQNKYFFLSAGHRYKAIPGFYLLRDKKFYSAFQNPETGIIPQPLERSVWAGGFFSGWGFGVFMGKNISENNLSYYLKSPKDQFAVTYSPETKYGTLYLDFRNLKFDDKKGEPEFTISSQILGDKKNYYGYINPKLIVPRQGIETEVSIYREDKGNLFAMNSDKSQIDKNTNAVFVKISRYHYDRIEAFQERKPGSIESVYGFNTALISGNLGAFCVKGRWYEKKDLEEEKQTSDTLAGGFGYEYRLKSTEFLLGVEERKNRDKLLEFKLTLKPIPNWKFEISSVVQSEENKFKSLFEQWSDGENVNTILTDRKAIFKLKTSGSFLVFNISGSRKKDGKGEVYFANFQFKTEF